MMITFGYIPTNATLGDILEYLEQQDETRILGQEIKQRILEEYPDNSVEIERLQERVEMESSTQSTEPLVQGVRGYT